MTSTLQDMSYSELCEHWAKQFVDQLTLTQLQQVTTGNMSCINTFPVLQRAHRVWCEIKRRQAMHENTSAPKLIL